MDKPFERSGDPIVAYPFSSEHRAVIHEPETKVSGGEKESVGTGSATDARLHELAEELSELRQQLEEVVVRLNGLSEERRGSRTRSPVAASGPASSHPGPDETGLHCHACGRRRPEGEEPGWTLRLCGDDELHPFCPECDSRDVGGAVLSRPVAQNSW